MKTRRETSNAPLRATGASARRRVAAGGDPAAAPPKETVDVPQRFRDWFARRGWQPRPHQLALLARARAGRSTLLIAPTGAGKTLAGFMPSLISLDALGRDIRGAGLHTLYISPLKALAVENEYELAVLVVTDIAEHHSLVLAAGDPTLVAGIPYARIDGSLYDAPGVVSRKKQIFPAVCQERGAVRTENVAVNQIAADVARQISTALNLDEVLERVVELTKQNFNLYHSHVYLVNEQESMLTMEAGAGDAGRIMKEAGHSIPLNAERSLVARAA